MEEANRRDQALEADPSRAIPGDDVIREAEPSSWDSGPGSTLAILAQKSRAIRQIEIPRKGLPQAPGLLQNLLHGRYRMPPPTLFCLFEDLSPPVFRGIVLLKDGHSICLVRTLQGRSYFELGGMQHQG
jgi:hypothetical protein